MKFLTPPSGAVKKFDTKSRVLTVPYVPFCEFSIAVRCRMHFTMRFPTLILFIDSWAYIYMRGRSTRSNIWYYSVFVNHNEFSVLSGKDL